eukprot:365538-Chlamydomonas_euryale.AAC.3
MSSYQASRPVKRPAQQIDSNSLHLAGRYRSAPCNSGLGQGHAHVGVSNAVQDAWPHQPHRPHLPHLNPGAYACSASSVLACGSVVSLGGRMCEPWLSVYTAVLVLVLWPRVWPHGWRLECPPLLLLAALLQRRI